MIKVELNYMRWLKSELKKINDIPFENIEWTQHGTPIIIPPDLLEEWKYIGLNNTSFPFSEVIGVTL